MNQFNYVGLLAIYKFELSRFKRTFWQSLVTPIITTMLFLLVFGNAIGERVGGVGGVSYAAFIVPGLIMLTILNESLSNSSFGIYMPKFNGTIYEILSAPLSPYEIALGYVSAAASKSIVLGLLILCTAIFFIDIPIKHPFMMFTFLIYISFIFSMIGFIIGVISKSFDELQFVPLLIITPLTFLGGAFYSIDMLPEVWRTATLLNPIIYIISTFRWSFLGVSPVSIYVSLGVITAIFLLSLTLIVIIFRTGYRVKT